MKIADIKKNIEKILDNNKAKNIVSINLKNKSFIADYMIIASGTSSRHLQALSEILINELKKTFILLISEDVNEDNPLARFLFFWSTISTFSPFSKLPSIFTTPALFLPLILFSLQIENFLFYLRPPQWWWFFNSSANNRNPSRRCFCIYSYQCNFYY